MKHITIELAAIDEIVGDRFLQSTEFSQGKALGALLKGSPMAAAFGAKLIQTQAAEGVYITTHNVSASSKFLVIDLVQSSVFSDFNDTEALFVFQKLLRFAKKSWQGLSLNFAERILPNSTKAVLFPFRGFKPAPFRITIEREPLAERLNKRGDQGKYLLVYKAGHDGGEGAREVPELTVFRKAYEGVGELRHSVAAAAQVAARSTPPDQLQVLSLDTGAAGGSIYRRYEDWLPLLTEQQREFVQAPITGPFRIEGAAGTGKTLALMLKAVSALRSAKDAKQDFHAVFVTHSDATKRSIQEYLSVIDGSNFLDAERSLEAQSLKVCTLSELCAEQLRQSISESEFIDRDAMESKALQLLYVNEAFGEAQSLDLPSHERFLSAEFASFVKQEDSWKISEMLQHEISVVIKGRASEDLDRYKKVTPLKYGLPIINNADKGYVFSIFRRYQQKLGDYGQFDTDDVVLTTIGQLDTPIWRRRRHREGYDAVFIDETHLFNINELHIFHYFTKVEGPYPIVYSVDRAQAVGDRGWSTQDIAESLTDDTGGGESARIRTIFRSSVDIVNLAFSVVSSGATLFTNFDNPVGITSSGFTEQDEKLSRTPLFINVANEEAMIEEAFSRAESMHKEMGCPRSDILIVSLDSEMIEKLQKFAFERNKPLLMLKKRGDIAAVELAKQSSQLVLGHADYVGGLEFAGVIIVGVDEGRVPPGGVDASESSKNYLSYVSHNRMYVAVTRARYRVEMLGEKARGPSKLIHAAISSGLLTVQG